MTRNEFTARELWLTTSDASRLLNINPRSIRKLIEKGRIDNVRVDTFDCLGQERYLVRVDNFDSHKRERIF